MEEFNKFMQTVATFFASGLGKVVLFVLVAIFGLILIKVLLKMLKKIFAKTKLDTTVSKFIVTVCKFVLYLLYFITLLAIVGVPITSLVAIITALTLGVTLAMQSTVSNLVNGVILMANKPYKLGDRIEVNGVTGDVIDINMFNTKLQTPTHEIITIPHNITINNPVTDLSACDKRRVVVTVGVAYGSDVAKVKEVLREVAKNNAYAILEEGIAVDMAAMSASSIDFGVKIWAPMDKYWDCLFSLNEQVYNALRENGIEIPYQTIDVNIKK